MSGFTRVFEKYHPLPSLVMEVLNLVPFHHFFEELKDKRIQMTVCDVAHKFGLPDQGYRIDVSDDGGATYATNF